MKKYRLLAQAQIDGALREVGYEFFLAHGQLGPLTAERLSHDRIDVAHDSNRILGKHKDVPLYEEVK